MRFASTDGTAVMIHTALTLLLVGGAQACQTGRPPKGRATPASSSGHHAAEPARPCLYTGVMRTPEEAARIAVRAKEKLARLTFKGRPHESLVDLGLRSVSPRLQRCICLLTRHRSVRVRVVVDGKTGRVTHARMVGIRDEDLPAADCIAETLYSITFPRFRGQLSAMSSIVEINPGFGPGGSSACSAAVGAGHQGGL